MDLMWQQYALQGIAAALIAAAVYLTASTRKTPSLVEQLARAGEREQAREVGRTLWRRLGWAVALLLAAMSCMLLATS